MVLLCTIAAHLSSDSRITIAPTRCLCVQRNSGRGRRGWHQRQIRERRAGAKYAGLHLLCARLRHWQPSSHLPADRLNHGRTSRYHDVRACHHHSTQERSKTPTLYISGGIPCVWAIWAVLVPAVLLGCGYAWLLNPLGFCDCQRHASWQASAMVRSATQPSSRLALLQSA